MSRFLKLTKVIINKNFIQHIEINKDKFIIHLMTNKMEGFSYLFESLNTEVKVCKTKDFIDYKIVTDWIDSDLN